MKRIIRISVLLLPAVILLGGCNKINSELESLRSEVSSLSERVTEIESAEIADIEKRLDALKADVYALQESDDVQESDLRTLQKDVDALSKDLAKVKESVSALSGAQGELSAKVEEMKKKIETLDASLTELSSVVTSLGKRVDALQKMETLTLHYIPDYTDKVLRSTYLRTYLAISGNFTMRFDVQPSSQAEVLAKNYKSALSLRAYTFTGDTDGESVSLSITGASAKDGVLSISVCTDPLGKAFIFGDLQVKMALKLSLGSTESVSRYYRIVPAAPEMPLIKYLLDNFDSDGDGVLENMDKVTSINLSGYGLTTIDDILPQLLSLETLDCSNNKLTSLNISGNSVLKSVNVSNNSSLTSLNVLNNTALMTLNASSCSALASLDVSTNTALTTLDVSNDAALTTLNASKTALTSLNLSKSTSLTTLDVSGTNLASLDISTNTALQTVNVQKTSLTELDILKNLSIKSLDVATAVKLILAIGRDPSFLQFGQYVSINGVGGLVIQPVTETSTTVSILSLDEAQKDWNSGLAWCAAKGSGWYMPTLSQLSALNNTYQSLNATLSEIGGTEIASNEEYWTSTKGNYTDYYYSLYYHITTGQCVLWEHPKGDTHRVRAARDL